MLIFWQAIKQNKKIFLSKRKICVRMRERERERQRGKKERKKERE